MSEDEDDGRHDACDTAHPHTPSAPIPIKSSKRGGGGSSSGTPTKGLIRTNSLHQEWLSGEQEEKRKHVGAPKKEDEEDFALSAPLSKEAAASGGEEGKRSGAGKGKKAAVEVVEELVETPREKLGPDQFELLAVIGIGAYGRVFQVKEKDSGRIYAMKVLQKGQILKKNNLRYVHEEKNILTRVDCPFVVSLMCAFQTTTKVSFVVCSVCLFVRTLTLVRCCSALFGYGVSMWRRAFPPLTQRRVIHGRDRLLLCRGNCLRVGISPLVQDHT